MHKISHKLMNNNKFCTVSYDQDTKIMTKIIMAPDLCSEQYPDQIKELKSNITSERLLTDNGRFKSYEVKGMMQFSGIMYVASECDANVSKSKEFKTESHQDYQNLKKRIGPHNLDWIYNIVDGQKEQEKIIYNSDDFLIIPDYTWKDHEKISDLHVLAIAKNKTLMSLRDIGSCDLDLLKKIRKNGLKTIETMYGLPENKIKMFFHYPPSTYLLHIHFMHIDYCYDGTSFERSHNLDDVIKNVQMNENYYHDDMRISS